jgi:hypothetical protein
MKRIFTLKAILMSALFSFVMMQANSQVILQEDFNNGWPAAWTTIDGDGNLYNANLGWIPNSGSWRIVDDFDSLAVMDSVAVSSSWYDPVAPADDWMITPQVTLGSNSQISYDEKAQDPAYPDGYELLISTTTPDVAGFTGAGSGVIYTVAAAANPSVRQTFNLAAYAGLPVYIAWHNNSTDQFVLSIDNVVIEQLAGGPDGAVSSVDMLSEYTQLPVALGMSINLGGTIENVGGSGATGAMLNADVELVGTGSVYTTSSTGIALASAATSVEALGTYVPTVVGSYVVHYDVSINEADGNAANDVMMSDTIMVTDSTIARDGGMVAGTLGIGAGTPGWLGNGYTIPAAAGLTSITWQIDPNATGTMGGQYTRAEVWDMAGGIPNAVVAVTDSMMLTGPGPHNVTMPIVGGAFSVPTDFVLVVVEGDSNTVLTYDANIYTAGATWVDFPGNPFAGWANSEQYNFFPAYHIRGNFATSVGLPTNELSNLNVNLFPNPVSNALNVQVSSEEAQDIQMMIVSSTGQVVYNETISGVQHLSTGLNTDNWATGVYHLRVLTATGVETVRFVKMK